MFTGLIQQVCTVKSLTKSAAAAVLTVDLSRLAEQTKIGDSIAINGVCLTVAKLLAPPLGGVHHHLAVFDISPETLEISNLAKLTASSKVNVELALKLGDPLGGHLVQGHIDGTAKIKQIKKQGEFTEITFAAAPELLAQMIPKGAVAVDGISLTIAALDKDSFTIALIPQTLKETTLGSAKITDTVNIEIDIITKTVKKHLENILPKNDKLTVEKLRQLGF